MIEKTIEGIKYRFNEETLTAEVIRKNGYVGDIIIPETIVFNQVSYGVTSIGNKAFSECESLTSIVIPDGVMSIGEWAFSECESLTSIVIPDGVMSIGEWAFYACNSLTSIVIPKSVKSIGESAFGFCESLSSVVVAEGNTVYDSREQCNAIIHTATNTLIRGCQNTIIPDGVTTIGEYAFSECEFLTSIVIPDSVTSIGFEAFYKCFSLTTVVIPDSVMSIERSAFKYCSSLTSIVIPDGVTSIGQMAFLGCSSLTSIVIPDSVTSIGDYAFDYCSSLKQNPTQEIEMSNCKYRLLMHNHHAMVIGYFGRSATINIPSEINHEGVIYRVTSIGYRAFYNCSSLTSIVIPDGVMSIGEWAFYACNSLTSIVIPDGVTSIGNKAFSECSSLISIVISKSVKSIGESAFGFCESLSSVVVAEGNTVYDSREQCNAIIHTATNTLIRGCQNTIIPDGVTTIGEYAFDAYDSLISIVIPDGVTTIGWEAFANCESLTSITFNGTKAQWKGINLGKDWHDFVPTKVIHCTDGDVEI